MTWKDEILLREMERFEARPPQVTGPRAPLPDPDASEMSEIRSLQATLSAAQWDLRDLSQKWTNALVRLQTAEYRADRNRKLFLVTAAGLGVGFLVAAVEGLILAGVI